MSTRVEPRLTAPEAQATYEVVQAARTALSRKLTTRKLTREEAVDLHARMQLLQRVEQEITEAQVRAVAHFTED